MGGREEGSEGGGGSWRIPVPQPRAGGRGRGGRGEGGGQGAGRAGGGGRGADLVPGPVDLVLEALDKHEGDLRRPARGSGGGAPPLFDHYLTAILNTI